MSYSNLDSIRISELESRLAEAERKLKIAVEAMERHHKCWANQETPGCYAECSITCAALAQIRKEES